MKVADVIEYLQRNYQPDDEVAYMLYCKTDVNIYMTTECKRFGDLRLTDVEQNEVLRIMNTHQDCENGMTWLSMDAAIDQVIEERA